MTIGLNQYYTIKCDHSNQHSVPGTQLANTAANPWFGRDKGPSEVLNPWYFVKRADWTHFFVISTDGRDRQREKENEKEKERERER